MHRTLLVAYETHIQILPYDDDPKFSASRTDRDKANKIINNLAKYSPSDQPAAAYYKENSGDTSMKRTLAGKWTLIYTDAPDITSLDAGPFSTAKLGRIGQVRCPILDLNFQLCDAVIPFWIDFLTV